MKPASYPQRLRMPSTPPETATQTYLVFDMAALERHLADKRTRIIAADAVTSDEALAD